MIHWCDSRSKAKAKQHKHTCKHTNSYNRSHIAFTCFHWNPTITVTATALIIAAAAAAKNQLSHHTWFCAVCIWLLFIQFYFLSFYVHFYIDDEEEKIDDTNADSSLPVSMFYIRWITCHPLFLASHAQRTCIHTQSSTLLMYLFCVYTHRCLFDAPFYVILQRLTFQHCADMSVFFSLITIVGTPISTKQRIALQDKLDHLHIFIWVSWK